MFIRYYNRNDKKAQKVSKIKKSVYKKVVAKILQRLCLSICLSVCIQKTSKGVRWSCPNFMCDLTWPQGRFMKAQYYKKLCPKDSDFPKIVKYAKKIILDLPTFLSLFYIVYKDAPQIEPQYKSWNKDGP